MIQESSICSAIEKGGLQRTGICDNNNTPKMSEKNKAHLDDIVAVGERVEERQQVVQRTVVLVVEPERNSESTYQQG